jgi:hypothetical protein
MLVETKVPANCVPSGLNAGADPLDHGRQSAGFRSWNGTADEANGPAGRRAGHNHKQLVATSWRPCPIRVERVALAFPVGSASHARPQQFGRSGPPAQHRAPSPASRAAIAAILVAPAVGLAAACSLTAWCSRREPSLPHWVTPNAFRQPEPVKDGQHRRTARTPQEHQACGFRGHGIGASVHEVITTSASR